MKSSATLLITENKCLFDLKNGGTCIDDEGNCTCQTGYANVENFCEETCALNPCKEMIKVYSKNDD